MLTSTQIKTLKNKSSHTITKLTDKGFTIDGKYTYKFLEAQEAAILEISGSETRIFKCSDIYSGALKALKLLDLALENPQEPTAKLLNKIV